MKVINNSLWLNLASNARVYYRGRACRAQTMATLKTVLLEDLETHQVSVRKFWNGRTGYYVVV